jgi:hypothetical protein
MLALPGACPLIEVLGAALACAGAAFHEIRPEHSLSLSSARDRCTQQNSSDPKGTSPNLPEENLTGFQPMQDGSNPIEDALPDALFGASGTSSSRSKACLAFQKRISGSWNTSPQEPPETHSTQCPLSSPGKPVSAA